MTIEAKIQELIESVNTLTDTIKKVSALAPTTPAADKPAAEKSAKKTTAAAEKPKQKSGEEVTAALNEVKEKFGAPAAKEIIAACGFAKLAELIQDGTKNDKAYELAKAKLEDEGGSDDDM